MGADPRVYPGSDQSLCCCCCFCHHLHVGLVDSHSSETLVSFCAWCLFLRHDLWIWSETDFAFVRLLCRCRDLGQCAEASPTCGRKDKSNWWPKCSRRVLIPNRMSCLKVNYELFSFCLSEPFPFSFDNHPLEQLVPLKLGMSISSSLMADAATRSSSSVWRVGT